MAPGEYLSQFQNLKPGAISLIKGDEMALLQKGVINSDLNIKNLFDRAMMASTYEERKEFQKKMDRLQQRDQRYDAIYGNQRCMKEMPFDKYLGIDDLYRRAMTASSYDEHLSYMRRYEELRRKQIKHEMAKTPNNDRKMSVMERLQKETNEFIRKHKL